MTDLGMIHSGADFDKLLAEIASIGSAKGLTQANAARLFDLQQGETMDAILADTFLGNEADLLTTVAQAMPFGTVTDQKHAPLLLGAVQDMPGIAALEVLERLLLTGAGAASPFSAKVDAFPGKDVRRDRLGDVQDALNALMLRVESARARRVTLSAVQKNRDSVPVRFGLFAAVRRPQSGARAFGF